MRVTGEEVKPVPIGYKGQLYVLHLGERNRRVLDDMLMPWIDGVTPHRPLPTITDHSPEEPTSETSTIIGPARRRHRPNKAKGRPDLPLIRAWAREQGITVTSHGRLKSEVIDAYDAAHLGGHPPTLNGTPNA